jgi:hypothetical protein
MGRWRIQQKVLAARLHKFQAQYDLLCCWQHESCTHGSCMNHLEYVRGYFKISMGVQQIGNIWYEMNLLQQEM